MLANMSLSLSKSTSRRADLDEKLNSSLDTLVHDSHKKVEICRDFNRGSCARGRACPYRHQKVVSEEVCRDYMRGQCPRGAECPYYHPKPNYVFTTERTNPPSSSSSSSSSPEYQLRRSAIPQICRDNLRGVCVRGAQCPYVHRTDYVEVCRDFLRGACVRGNQCPFHHLFALVESHQLGRDVEICRDYQRGECDRRPCPYLHVPEVVEICRNFMENKCRNGSRCQYHHPIPTENGHEHRKKRARSSYESDDDKEHEKSPTELNRELLDQIRLLKEENQVLKEENILIRTESNRLREKLSRSGLDSYGL